MCKSSCGEEDTWRHSEGRSKRRERKGRTNKAGLKSIFKTILFICSSIIISYMCSIHELLFNTRAKQSKMWSGSSPCLFPHTLYILSILRSPPPYEIITLVQRDVIGACNNSTNLNGHWHKCLRGLENRLMSSLNSMRSSA